MQSKMMPTEIRIAIAGLDLPREISAGLLNVMEEEGPGIPWSRKIKLLKLVCLLRSNACTSLGAVHKRELFGNLLDLLKQGQEEWAVKICCLVHAEKPRPRKGLPAFPEDMVDLLVKLVNTEKSERVREILWALLLRRDMRLENLAGAEDVISGLSENNPVTRNRVARFLFDHFSPDHVLEIVLEHALNEGRRIPGVALKRYADLLAGKEALDHKKALLSDVLDACEFKDDEMDRVWSDYLKGLSRFDLIRAERLCRSGARWLSGLKRKSRQMAFAFDEGTIIPSPHRGFAERISAIVGCRH